MYLQTVKTFPDGSEAWWRREDGVCARRHQVCGLLRARVIEHRYIGPPATSAAHLAKKEAFQRGRSAPPLPGMVQAWVVQYPVQM